MRTSLLIFLLLLAGTALPFWWSPYSASGRLAIALEEGDEAVLAAAIDVERLQRGVAYHVRTSYSIQRNPTLDPRYQEAFDALIEDVVRQEIERRTRRSEILQLVRRALGQPSQGTRFARAWQLLQREALQWRDASAVYIGAPDEARLLMTRSGLMWRVVALQFPEPKVQFEVPRSARRGAR